MTVPILRLHDLGAVNGGPAHVLDVLGLMFGVLGVGVGQRVGPHLVDLDRLFGVRGLLQDVGGFHGLFVLVVLGAFGEQGLLHGRRDLEGRNVDRSLGVRVECHHGEGARHEDVFG